MENIAVKLAFVGAAGIMAQWLAWRLRLPAIVLLLAAGFHCRSGHRFSRTGARISARSISRPSDWPSRSSCSKAD
jgi:ribose/xylose/arabinose/galactoside ABC-type transport system permease subunit